MLAPIKELYLRESACLEENRVWKAEEDVGINVRLLQFEQEYRGQAQEKQRKLEKLAMQAKMVALSKAYDEAVGETGRKPFNTPAHYRPVN